MLMQEEMAAADVEKLPREIVERLLWRPEDTPDKLDHSIHQYNTVLLQPVEVRPCSNSASDWEWRSTPASLFRLDALALSVIATATWLGGWVGGCLSQPVLYQND